MDITLLFKACVKTIRTRNKALGMILPEMDKNRILITHKVNHSEFTNKAKDILNLITRLRDFLLEHRTAYLNLSANLSTLPKMSDYERDKIDSGAQRIIKTCSLQITELRRDMSMIEGQLQLVEHQNAAVDLLDAYLKTVCKIYTDQKVTRAKRNLEIQKMSRLESENFVSEKSVSTTNNSHQPVRSASIKTEAEFDDSVPTTASVNIEKNSVNLLSQEDDLTAEELQMFENENEQLYNDLNSLVDEVKQIKSKVVEIAELQEMFTEKVLVQEKDIDRIYGTVVGTTEDVRDANTQIRQAIQNNAGLRFFVLFFLLVMSLTLLFLDWYND